DVDQHIRHPFQTFLDGVVDTRGDFVRLANGHFRIDLEVQVDVVTHPCAARRTGMRYHVDLHLEVDPEMTVRESHEIATSVNHAIKERLEWVADVLVHV